MHELILIPGLRASFLSYFTNLADARKGICAFLSVVDLGWTRSLGAKGEENFVEICLQLWGEEGLKVFLVTVPEPREVLHPFSRNLLVPLTQGPQPRLDSLVGARDLLPWQGLQLFIMRTPFT